MIKFESEGLEPLQKIIEKFAGENSFGYLKDGGKSW